MNRFDDLFDKSPPPGHSERVLLAAQPYLLEARQKQRRQLFVFLGAATTSALGVALYLRNLSDRKPPNDLDLMAIDIDKMNPDDIELLADIDEIDTFTDDEFDLIYDLSLTEEG